MGKASRSPIVSIRKSDQGASEAVGQRFATRCRVGETFEIAADRHARRHAIERGAARLALESDDQIDGKKAKSFRFVGGDLIY